MYLLTCYQSFPVHLNPGIQESSEEVRKKRAHPAWDRPQPRPALLHGLCPGKWIHSAILSGLKKICVEFTFSFGQYQISRYCQSGTIHRRMHRRTLSAEKSLFLILFNKIIAWLVFYFREDVRLAEVNTSSRGWPQVCIVLGDTGEAHCLSGSFSKMT